MGTIAQLFRVLWAPRKVFHSVSRNPRLVAPLALLVLFAAVESAVVFSTLDPGELRLEQFQREGYADRISESDKAIHAQNARDYRTIAAVFSSVRSLVIVPIVGATLFLLLGLGRGVPFRPFMAVTAFAFIPAIFHSLAIIGTVLFFEPTPETLQLAGSLSPVLFLDQASVPQGFYFAISMADVVSIWILALLTIGYRFVLRDDRPAWRLAAVAGAYCLWTGVYVAIRLATG